MADLAEKLEPDEDMDVEGAEVEVNMSQDDANDSSDSGAEEGNATIAGEIEELQKQISVNPFVYDNHVKLIKLFRECGELDGLRGGRQQMSQHFPLSEELWLDWLRDEIKLISGPKDRERVSRLCERATKDYLSVEVWLEYVQFSIGGMADPGGIAAIRSVFEKAITAAGLHVTKGALIWEAYREFECAILAGLQATPGSVLSSTQIEQANAQTRRVQALFRRELSVPLQDLESVYEEYEEWCDSGVEETVQEAYERALNMYKQLQTLEEALEDTPAPCLQQYMEYIEHEENGADPVRIQCIYERALQENCLVAELWLRYTKYLDQHLPVREIVLCAHERSSRNCPWSAPVWTNYMRALERFETSHEKVKEVFDSALTAGFSEGADYFRLWSAYCDYLRRRVNWETEHDHELAELRDCFQKAVDNLHAGFPLDGDPNCSLLQYWARIEAKFAHNMEKARDLWNQILQQGFGSVAQAWLDYFNLERAFGDHKHCRKILQRAVNSVSDWPESVCEAYVNFEREEGSLEQFDQAVLRCEAQLKRVTERKKKETEKDAQGDVDRKKKHQEKKGYKSIDKNQQKTKQQDKQQSQGKKKSKHQHLTNNSKKEVEPPTDDTSNDSCDSGTKSFESETPKVFTRKRPSSEDSLPTDHDGFKVPPPPGALKSSPTSSYEPSVKKSRGAPPPGFKGPPPPGYKGTSREAPTPDVKHTALQSSPLDAATDSTNTDSLPDEDEQTVFISNLNYKLKESVIMDIFSKVGEVTEIRMVRDYKKNFKGFGYVQFIDELTAQKALDLDRTPIEGRPMYVSKCNKKRDAGDKFKYATILEKNKLFVSGLPFTATKEALRVIFSAHGALKDIRLITHKSGAPKGLAYVEFENEKNAVQALLKADGLSIDNHTISVAISNPPMRKMPLTPREEKSFKPSLGGGKRQSADRGRARTQLSLMPRSLSIAPGGSTKHTQPAKLPSSISGDNKSASKMSNSDFHNMLLQK